MDDKEFITITDNDCNTEKFELLTILEKENSEDEFVIYTDNVEDKDGNINIYASKSITVDGKDNTLVDLTDEEWAEVESFLEQMTNEESEEE